MAAFLSKYAGRERQAGDHAAAAGRWRQRERRRYDDAADHAEHAADHDEHAPASTLGHDGTGGRPRARDANAQGKQVFTESCGFCHTLKDAGTTGTVGPNLDDLTPDEATVQRQVTNGGGVMPAFKGQLTDAQIKAVSQYVSSVAGQ